MRIIDPGHVFELDHLDGPGKTILDFVKRVGKKFPGNENPHEGVISQEILRALISRTEHIQNQCYLAGERANPFELHAESLALGIESEEDSGGVPQYGYQQD